MSFKLIKSFITKKMEAVLQRSTYADSKNIELKLQLNALKETADYINEKMSNVQSCGRKEEVLKIASEICEIDGFILEFGVYSGTTINYISSLFEDHKIYGFDSFEGLPEDWRDGFPRESFKLNKLPNVNENVELIKGWFDSSLPVFLSNNDGYIKFLHIDCDLYSSTKTIFKNLKDRIRKGTVIVFDEYFNYSGWKNGEFKAFQEFIGESNFKYKYLTYNKFHEQVVVIIE